MAGVFFRDYVSALGAAGIRTGVIFPDLVSPRYWLTARDRPIISRMTTTVEGATPVVRIRGLHCAFRVPGLQMGRFACWLRRGFEAYCAGQGEPDVLHAMCAIPSGWACLQLGSTWRRRTLITEHTGPFAALMTTRAGGRYVRQALDDAPMVAAVSGRLRRDMLGCGITRDIQVIPNPVGPEFLDASAPPGTTMEGGRREFNAVFVGRLVAEKGLRELADAAIRLQGKPGVTIRWHFVGEGPLAEEIGRRFAEAGMARQLVMHGLCDKAQVAGHLRTAHFLVHPSHVETGALSVCEALSIGRPAVGTRRTACEEWIGPGDGVLCDAGSVDSLVLAVEEMIGGYERWNWRGIAERAARRFRPNVVAQQYAALYEQLRRSAGGGA